MDPLVGAMLGKDYRVLEPIGFGGMGVVYLVEHQTLRKRFAAKVLSVELAANPEPKDRTLRFRIDALLRADPAPEPVIFDSTLEPATTQFAVTGG